MKPTRIVVDGYSERWLERGFPWVYRKELLQGGGRPGQLARVFSRGGKLLGTALLDDGWIAARVYRHGEGPLDRAWVHERLDRAAALRQAVVPPDTTAWRLVHGENDGLPGLRIDWWSHYAVLVLDTPAVAPLLPWVVEWLKEHFGPRGITLCYRPDPRDERDFSGVEPAPGMLDGHPPPGAVRVRERGLNFDVYPLEGPDVGLYCDMRDVRAWLEPTWGGTTVLNTFAFTGAFSVAAAWHGASHVTSVDLSRRVLERAEANFQANELDPAMHDFVASDTFKALDRFRRTGQQFDRIVLDPPAFSRADEGIWSAKRDYPRLVAAAARVTAPDGWIIAASNQGEVSPREFAGFVADGLKRAGRNAQRIFAGGQGPDFPAAVHFPEGAYLKVGVWRLVD